VSHLEKEYGVHYAIGGVQAIADAMARVVEGQGGRLRLGVEADEILVRDGAAEGVRLVSGEVLRAPLVISNADAGHTYTRLLRNMARKRWSDAKVGSRKWSMGLYVWYFGTQGTKGMWPDVGHHTILSGPRYEGLLRDIFVRGRLADDMSLYVHRPSVTDPGVAPEGGDTFYALSPVPHLGHADPVDWAQEEPRYREKVTRVLEGLIPGFEKHLSASLVFTPETFRDRYLSPLGCGFSIEPRILQSAWFRPHNVSEEARGLFLVGAGTHPGAGLPGVVSSAEVMAKMIPDAATVPVRMAAE
jgi:phytoene desaturase